MSQTPHPHDPYGTGPGDAVPEQPLAPRAPEGSVPDPADRPSGAGDNAPSSSPSPDEDRVSPTSDPIRHPHDPFASAPSAQPVGASADPGVLTGPSAQHGSGGPGGPYGPGDPQGPGGQYGPGGQHGPQVQYGPDAPPSGVPGVYDGPLTGEPASDSDARLWAMFSQLSVTLGHVVSWGFLGWVGPLVIFLVYKDRNRFVRFHAAEALNGAISVVIAQVALSIVLGILAVITLGIGSFLLVLVPVPALVQFVFSIIGAIKANQGQWWNYPLNIRLVK